VHEIQERVQKAQFDGDYEGSVAKDLDLVKQVDSAKREMRQWQNQANQLEKEVHSLKKDLAKAAQKIILQV
jgi:uncharacterized protein YlxW (UPF0749 family)